MVQNNKLLISLIVSILVFFLIGEMAMKPKAKDYPPYLSISSDLDGTKGLFLLLKEHQQPVHSWSQAWRFLPEGQNQALLVTQPLQLYAYELKSIKKWVAKGNVLLLFSDHPIGLKDVPYRQVNNKTSNFLQNIQGKTASQIEKYKGIVSTEYRMQKTNESTTLLRDAYGIIASSSSWGKGKIITFLTPEWLMNQNILQDSHFEMIWPQFMHNWGAIWFDDYHHGIQKAPGLLAVYPPWLIMLLVQLIMALFFWLWQKGKRFGPIYTPREWVVRRGDETLLAVSSWYERKRLWKDAIFHQETYLRQLMQERWGIVTYATPQQILSRANVKWSQAQMKVLSEVLHLLEKRKTDNHYTKKRLLEDSKKIEELTHWLDKE